MAGSIGEIIDQQRMEEQKKIAAQATPISVGNRVAPMNTSELSIQQAQQGRMRGLYGGKKMGSKGKKETEKNENKEWDTGFGELYESIGDRKVKKLFPELKDLLE